MARTLSDGPDGFFALCVVVVVEKAAFSRALLSAVHQWLFCRSYFTTILVLATHAHGNATARSNPIYKIYSQSNQYTEVKATA
mmetsp:Transcript_14641/g.33015  ORF Transcript_14641/g.33015 Transcript_14641/m.33015 type:complete len:83 (-) Transcript_14641:296-544(-)